MASNMNLPPYIRLANIQGAIILRRSTSQIWVGRALSHLAYAKQGYQSHSTEQFVWRKMETECALCLYPTHLKELYRGTGMVDKVTDSIEPL